METSENRRHKREEIIKVMGCTIYQQSNQPIEFDCVSTNISQSGIGLLTTTALKKEQDIELINDIFPYPRTATVRWSKEYNGLYYTYGLEFIEQLRVTPQ